MKNTTKAVLLAAVVLSIIAVAVAYAETPTVKTPWPDQSTTPGYDVTGSILGKVTTFNGTGIPNADVWIVNASNTSQYFWKGTTNAQGEFHLTSVNNTWNGTIYAPIYKVYSNHSLYGDGYSQNFSVEAGSTSWATVIIEPIPNDIEIGVLKTTIPADGTSTTKVWAYVTDAMGNPVADNTQVTFTFSNVTLPYIDVWVGNWSVDGTKITGTNTTTVGTSGGYANLTYGYVPDDFAGNNTTIKATVANYPNINDSVTVYFKPTVVSWFGGVVDTYGNGQGGVPVVLHVGYFDANGDFYEVYNITEYTKPEMPFPGSYVFDNIIMWPNITSAYATAAWTIADNVTIDGQSNYYELNKSSTSAGFIILHVPLPDEIRVTAYPDTILTGGDVSTITAQLYLNGQPYRRPLVPINFFSDNDSRAYLPAVKTNVSDTNGKATILLTSAMNKGDVNVTAYSQINILTNLTDTVVVKVTGWGTISGMVTDQNKNGVPNATVKLYRTIVNESGIWSTTLFESPENPQWTVSRPEVAAIGTYTYYKIPSGIYNVTAEKADASGNVYLWFAHVNLTEGTATNNVAIPGLVISLPGTPTPTLSPTQAVTPSPTPQGATPTTTPTPGFEVVFALAGLMGVAYLLARKEN